MALLAILAACGGGDEHPVAPDEEEAGPDLSAEQAGAAIADAFLVTSRALYLAITAPSDSRSVSSPNGALMLSWSEDADFLTGTGTYEVELDDYTIPEDDPFAELYNGHRLTGRIELASPAGEPTALDFDLQVSHPEPEVYPAQSIRIDLTGLARGEEREPEGRLIINGRLFTFEELAPAFTF